MIPQTTKGKRRAEIDPAALAADIARQPDVDGDAPVGQGPLSSSVKGSRGEKGERKGTMGPGEPSAAPLVGPFAASSSRGRRAVGAPVEEDGAASAAPLIDPPLAQARVAASSSSRKSNVGPGVASSSSSALPPGILRAVGALPPAASSVPPSQVERLRAAIAAKLAPQVEAAKGLAPIGPVGPPPPAAAPTLGVVGITQRDDSIKTLLRIFAKSDFKHDFGEKVPSRDLITRADRPRFVELVQKFPVKQRVDLINKFDKMFPSGGSQSTNLLELLGGGIAKQLYPEPDASVGAAAEFVHEVDVLKYIGVDYEALKNSIKDHFVTRGQTTAFVNDAYAVKRDGIFNRNYRVGAQKYKNGDGTTRNLASLFRDVAGGEATKFALLVDASLGMSTSSIGDSRLDPNPGAACTFDVLYNVEGDGDSATGVSDFAVVEDTRTGATKNPTTTVRLMRDFDTSTVLYPIWNDRTLPLSEAENLFSKIQILLNRVESGEIEASVILGDESHTVPDVGTTSNVKNASLNGLAAWFTREILKEAATKGDERKPYIYALLKRMGDWCQALSLLDRTRTYTAMDPKTKKRIPEGSSGYGKATLQELISQGYELGLVTNDRILLAYGLILGLNVYFTTASDLNCLVYFKNKDDIADEGALARSAANNIDVCKDLLKLDAEETAASASVAAAAVEPTIHGTVETKIGVAVKKYSKVVSGNPEYAKFDTDLTAKIRANLISRGASDSSLLDGIVNAFKFKVLVTNIGELQTNFAEIQTEVDKSIAVYNNPGSDAKTKFTASVTLVNLANRLKTMKEHNKFVMERLESGAYGNKFVSEQNVFVDLSRKFDSGGRMSNSELMARAKDILLSCRDDVKQLRQKNLIADDLLLTYIPSKPVEVPPPTKQGDPTRPSARDISNFETLYGAFDAIRGEIPGGLPVAGGGQRGGANLALIRSIIQREVFPYKTAKLETAVNELRKVKSPANDAALALIEFLPAAQIGTFYRDEKSRPYSVIDRYLITKEDSKSLVALVEEVIAKPKTVIQKDAMADLSEEDKKGIQTANNVIDFIVYRFALLYHDILYERFERAFDPSYTAGAPDGLSNESKDITEGAEIEFYKVAQETGTLRIYVNRYSNGDSSVVSNLLKSFQGDIFKAAPPVETLTSGESTFYERLTSNRLVDKVKETRTSLRNLRDTLFASYAPILIDVVPRPTETATRDDIITAAGVEDILDDTELGGGSRLESVEGGDVNASDTRTGSARRGLYAGLRKRSGSGSPPGV